MKRIMVWLTSLILGLITTFIMFIPLEIPFVGGRGFTLITILLMTFFFSLILDAILKAGVYDEHGLHFGPLTFGTPRARKELPPPPDYQPIVSREERLRQEQKAESGNRTAGARRH